MKRGFLGRVIGAGCAACCLAMSFTGCGSSDSSSSEAAGTAAAPGQTSAAEITPPSEEGKIVLTDSKTGRDGDYDYELWKDKGDTKMIIGEGGNFYCEWQNINNALFRRGNKISGTKTYKDLGDTTIEYGVDYQPDGNSYLCVYGWTKDPLIEYYIVESWGNWRPPGQADIMGTVTVDGGTYDIYRSTRYEQPSIEGTKTFDQYWSVRKEKPVPKEGTKLEGTISVSKHFQAWEECGLEMGSMYEVAFNVEGYQSKGKADIYKNVLTFGDSYTPDPDLEIRTVIAKDFFKNDFESDIGNWQARGDSVSVSRSKDKAKDGSGSLEVKGRKENWHGASISLDKSTYKPGSSFSFKADVMQESGKAANMKMTLQYNDTNGQPQYSEITSADAESGEWITLENPSYQIPEGADGMILYIESPDSLCDFYVDNAEAAKGSDSGSGDKKGGSDANIGGDPVALTLTADTSWIDPSKPMVAIAFDDGASATKKGDPAYRIIDTMADNGFHATFFYVGNWIKTEEQVKYAYEKGMEIANHTMTHPYLSKMTPEKIREEFDKTNEKLKGIIGAEPSHLMRLPYLDCNDTVKKTLNDVGLISCSIDTLDWNKGTTEKIVDKLKKAKENGSLENAIVLCHENYEATAAAMEEIVPWLKAEGWQVVTISELFTVKNKTMMGGTVYTKLS